MSKKESKELKHELIPLLPRYLDRSIDLFALQFSKENTAKSPVTIGLEISQQDVKRDIRPFFQRSINSPHCCLLINPDNDDIISVIIIEETQKQKNSTLNKLISMQKVLMDEYLESKASLQAKELLANIRKNFRVLEDGYLCVNPKYTHHGIANVASIYHYCLMQDENIRYTTGSLANEYSKGYAMRATGGAVTVISKAKYSEIFDHLGIEYKNGEIKGLLESIEKHPYRYFGIVDLENENLARKLKTFRQRNAMRLQLEKFHQIRKQYNSKSKL